MILFFFPLLLCVCVCCCWVSLPQFFKWRAPSSCLRPLSVVASRTVAIFTWKESKELSPSGILGWISWNSNDKRVCVIQRNDVEGLNSYRIQIRKQTFKFFVFFFLIQGVSWIDFLFTQRPVRRERTRANTQDFHDLKRRSCVTKGHTSKRRKWRPEAFKRNGTSISSFLLLYFTIQR